MKSLLRKIYEFFTPNHLAQGSYDERRRSSLLILFSWTLLAFAMVYSLIYKFRYHASDQAIQLFISGLIVATCPFIFKLSRSIKIAANAMLLLTIVVFTSIYITTKGVSGSMMFWFPLIPSIAIILIGPRMGIIWGFFCSVILITVAFLQKTSSELITITDVIPDEARFGATLSSAIGVLILFPTLFTIYENTKNRMMEEVQKAKAESEKLRLKAQQAHSNARMVLDNVAQGLMVINFNGDIQSEFSAPITKWFGVPELDEKVWEFLGKENPSFGDQFMLAWSQLADDILPPEVSLGQLPTELRLRSGDYLEFQPIYLPKNEGSDRRIFLVVTDITTHILAKRTEQSRKELMSLYEKLSKSKSFTSESLKEVGDLVEELLKRPSPTLEAQLLHTLKGTSAVLGLNSIASFCHQLEDKISENQCRLSEADVLQLQGQWKRIWDKVNPFLAQDGEIHLSKDEYQSLLNLVSAKTDWDKAQEFVAKLSLESLNKRFSALSDQIHAIAKQLDKGRVSVEFNANNIRLDREKWSPFWSTFIHAVRNAIDHGLESPQDRVQAGKPEIGTIRLFASNDENGFTISIADDGSGIDWAKIKEKAQKAGLPSKNHEDLVNAMFSDGISSRDSVSEISGRGIGLSALKETCLNLNGTISIETLPGKGTTMKFKFPHEKTLSEVA